MKIILAHPSWPWVDESLSMALHKENVFIDLSGWSPKYFAPQIIQYANTQLRGKMLFGSDFPLIHPAKWIEAAKAVGFRDDALPAIMKDSAARLLGLELWATQQTFAAGSGWTWRSPPRADWRKPTWTGRTEENTSKFQ